MPPTTRQTSRRLYQPLDRNSRQIRLIEILPTYANQTIQCKLHTVTLTPETYYVCISYVWGDPSITEEIVVNGVRKSVTVNLATALKHLKKHWVQIESESDPNVDTSKFRLWADALSINQDDPLERGHQVGLMADIYSSAEMVLAWLSSDDRDVAMDFNILERVLLQFGNQWDRIGTVGCGSIQHGLSWLHPQNRDTRENNDTGLLPDEPLFHLRQIWKLGFWSRVWIQQEVILAKRVYYISPSHKIGHKRYWIANKWVKRWVRTRYAKRHYRSFTQLQKEAENNLLQCQRGATNLFEVKDHVGQMSKDLFISACINLHFSEGLKATDDLDYVYGLLAISRMPLEPDYTKSIREVYIEFVQWMVGAVSGSVHNTERVYELLDRHAIGIRQLHGLPTWAPVFSASDKRHHINLSRWSKSPLYESTLPVVTSWGSLWTRAIKAQTVEAVYHEPGSPGLFCETFSSFILDFPKIWEERAGRRRPRKKYKNDDLILMVLCCTLLLKSDCQYNIQRFFIALMASGLCRPEDFDRDLLESVGSSELESITQEWKDVANRMLGSMLFNTQDGYIGLIGDKTLPGDVVCYLAGGKSLTVLRPKDGHYLFVNNCFVIGLMDEDASKFVTSGGLKPEEIEIR